MNKQLKILILEDCADDVDLIERELKRGGLQFTSAIVKKKDEYERALSELRPDVVLSDHSLPQFNSVEAMEICKRFQKQHNVSIPFILITGSVSEEFAVQSIKAGADDYILKDRLKRLPSSIKNALDKAKIERERLDFLAETIAQSALMKEAEHLANFGSWQIDLATRRHQWTDQAIRMFGFVPGEIHPDEEKFFANIHPQDRDAVKQVMNDVVSSLPSHEFEYRIIEKDNNIRYLHSKIVVKRNEAGHAYQMIGFILDVTEQKKQTLALETQNRTLMEIAWVQSHEVRAPLARIMGLIQLLNDFPEEKTDLKNTLAHILQSARELDEVVRKIVRKTEENV